jgi:hypothetical protein
MFLCKLMRFFHFETLSHPSHDVSWLWMSPTLLTTPQNQHDEEKVSSSFCCFHSPLLKTRDGGDVSSVDASPPTPALLETRDGGGVSSVDTLHPLPCSKRKMGRGFPLLMHHHQPLPRSNCEIEELSVNTPPPTPSLT